MKATLLLALTFLPLLLAAAEPEGGAEKEAGEKQVEMRPVDMTPEELSQATKNYYDKVLERKIRVDPAERKELFAAHGPVMKMHLIKKFREAKSIVFTEISDQWDFDFPEGTAPETIPQYEYESVTLTAEQRKNAVEQLEAMDSASGRGAVCFHPHHRLDMEGADEKTTRILICRECNRIRWEGVTLDSPAKAPWILSNIMKAAGLDLAKDWDKLAMERWAQERPSTSGVKTPAK